MMNMTDKNVKTAEGYYQAMGRKSVADVEEHIHPEADFIAPLVFFPKNSFQSFRVKATGFGCRESSSII